ncbi:hypothetical protein BaRGS_00011440, partial [Batillaria attramentaria]
NVHSEACTSVVREPALRGESGHWMVLVQFSERQCTFKTSVNNVDSWRLYVPVQGNVYQRYKNSACLLS